MNPEVKLSDSEILQLSNAGHNEIADLASGNNTLDIKKLRVASQASRDALVKEILQVKIADATRTGLQGLLEEAAKNPGVSPKVPQEEKPTGSSSVQESANNAMTAMKAALEPQGKPPAEFLSGGREIKAKFPGMEVGGLSEIKDALNQSRQYNKDLINYLVAEAAKPDLTLSFNSWPFSNRPGMFLDFPSDKFASVAEKQEAIKNALNNLESLWSNQGKDASGMGMWGWTATIIGFYFGYKIIWKGSKVIVSKVKWFGIGPAAVAVMDAVGGVAGENAEKVKELIKSHSEQQKAAIKARGFMDPTSSEYIEIFSSAQNRLKELANGSVPTISPLEYNRRMLELDRIRAEYITQYTTGKFSKKYAGDNMKVQVGYTIEGNFGKGSIDGRMGLGRVPKIVEATRNIGANLVRDKSGGRFFGNGRIGAINTLDNLNSGNSMDPLLILGESHEYKDADTRGRMHRLQELSLRRYNFLRIQQALQDIKIARDAFIAQEAYIKGMPTDEKIKTTGSTATIVNAPGVAPTVTSISGQDTTTVLEDANKERTRLLAEKTAAEMKLSTLTQGESKISATYVTRQLNGIAKEIGVVIGELKAAYPASIIPDLDKAQVWDSEEKAERFVRKIGRVVRKI